jgi:hypothetical protein
MKRTVAVISLLSAWAWAQEIGTEIAAPPPTTPSANEAETVTPGPKPPAKRVSRRGPRAQEKPEWEGPQLSAASGSFGIRGSFSPSVGGVSSVGTTTSLTTGTVGVAVWATDGLALSFDVGGGVLFGSGFWSAAAIIGVDYHFATPAVALRPLFHFSAGVHVLANVAGGGVSLVANIGGGAAYFFSKNFSLTGKLLLTVPMAFPAGSFTFGLFSATPAIGAAWYF